MAEEREKSMKELQEENIRVQTAHLREQTEFYREQNEETRLKRENRRKAHADQELVLADGRARERRVQRACTHQKGGKGDDLVNNSAGSGVYAMADQDQPTGQRWRMCTRCFAIWKPGDTAKSHPTGISYKEAMRWPTDNSPSGTVLFRFPEQRTAEGSQELVPQE